MCYIVRARSGSPVKVQDHEYQAENPGPNVGDDDPPVEAEETRDRGSKVALHGSYISCQRHSLVDVFRQSDDEVPDETHILHVDVK